MSLKTRYMASKKAAGLRRLLADVLPTYSRKTDSRSKAAMVNRLEEILKTYPDESVRSGVIAIYSLARRPNVPRTDAERSVLLFLRTTSRREYIRTGSTDFMETYFDRPTILQLQRHGIYVPEDLDDRSPDDLPAYVDLPPRVRLQMEAFWTKRAALSCRHADPDPTAAETAGKAARERLGRDQSLYAAAGYLSDAVGKLVRLQSGSYGTDRAEDLEREARILVSTAYRLLGDQDPKVESVAAKRLSLLEPPKR